MVVEIGEMDEVYCPRNQRVREGGAVVEVQKSFAICPRYIQGARVRQREVGKRYAEVRECTLKDILASSVIGSEKNGNQKNGSTQDSTLPHDNIAFLE